jgi:hypothetical protein
LCWPTLLHPLQFTYRAYRIRPHRQHSTSSSSTYTPSILLVSQTPSTPKLCPVDLLWKSDRVTGDSRATVSLDGALPSASLFNLKRQSKKQDDNIERSFFINCTFYRGYSSR